MNYESAPLQLPADHPALAGHFPQSPVAPGVWLPTTLEHAARMGSGLRITAIDYMRFRTPPKADQVFVIRFRHTAAHAISFAIEHGTNRIADGRISIALRA